MYDLELSRRLTLIKSSRAVNRVSWLKITKVSGTISVPIIRAEMSRLIAREGFINLKDKFASMWKTEVVVQTDKLSEHSLGKTQENNKNHHPGLPVPRPRHQSCYHQNINRISSVP
jgi:hypothetical protein